MIQSITADQVIIWQLLCRYCHLVDRGNMADVVDLFHPDATLVLPPNPPARGREAIRKAYDEWLRTAREPTVWLRHKISSPFIDVDGDQASAVSYLTADFLLRKKGTIQALVGRYQDELIRNKDRWLLWRRDIFVDARLDFGKPL